MARNGLIVMTGLPLTIGHGHLTRFAANFMASVGGELYIMIYSRSFEPVPGSARFQALREFFKNDPHVSVFHVADDDVPQNPSEDPDDFWGNWRTRIRDVSPNKDGDYLFASEKYAVDLARVINCEYVPCDLNREIIKISGTEVRQQPIPLFSAILPEMQGYFRKTITMFGQESCGKSTMTKNLGAMLDGYTVPEWARVYLELPSVGPEITEEKMAAIAAGQYISQKTVSQLRNKPFIFQDTDLLSTIGYYEFWHGSCPPHLYDHFRETKSDLYFVMNDAIPFEADPLRYGGDKRETTKQFWIDLLKRNECRYHVVEATDQFAQLDECASAVLDLFLETASMAAFVRT